MHLSLRTKIIVAFAMIALGGYAVNTLNFSSATVPGEFTEARSQGATIADTIVGLSNQVTEELGKVQALDNAKQYADALDAVNKLVKKSDDVRAKAIELSQQLARMTTSLSEIGSQEARAAALEAIADRLAIINKLINYSNYLSELTDALRARFEGTGKAENIAKLVNQINGEVTAINNFNRQATDAMLVFDRILKK